ncbi:MAG: glucosaminidase domain-containing protein, partial [Deltaproteobacteria bacterium]
MAAALGETERVATQRTPLTRAQIRDALSSAYQSRHGTAIQPGALDVLTAHVCHETGGGRSMFNHNFGGIKGVSPEGQTTVCGTQEYIQGHATSLRLGFRAYDSTESGASDYLGLLERRYAPALAAANRRDTEGFVHELHAGGYFSAPEADYARSMRSLTGGVPSTTSWPSETSVAAS